LKPLVEEASTEIEMKRVRALETFNLFHGIKKKPWRMESNLGDKILSKTVSTATNKGGCGTLSPGCTLTIFEHSVRNN